jgi:hypothetical protein
MAVIKDDDFARAEESNDPTVSRAESPAVEGEDFYLENGLYVFTAGFLLRRGYCCDNNCRHCPYPKESYS